MRVTLKKVSKRFGAQKVLSEVDLALQPGSVTGLTGPNGSGKSTLLKLVAGSLKPDDGEVWHESGGERLQDGSVFRYVTIAAPYLNLYEELSLTEAFDLHSRFKKLSCHADEFFRIVHLEKAKEKSIEELSSGMRQRFKLGLALLGSEELLLLDEPGSNLDAQGLQWFQELLTSSAKGRTVLICSNREEEELTQCDRVIAIDSL